jgi:hypothetical protein
VVSDPRLILHQNKSLTAVASLLRTKVLLTITRNRTCDSLELGALSDLLVTTSGATFAGLVGRIERLLGGPLPPDGPRT